MTLRERQILNWIEENPMISQEELASRAGITRSSVAVHISNLTRKGYIAGRGYVLENGLIRLSDTAQALLGNDEIRKSYLGSD